MALKTLSLPNNFDGRIRLFPLRDNVLFPGNVQQLKIFEPRYCEMLREALETDSLITMATLSPHNEMDNAGRPAIAPVVCIGRVVFHQANADESHGILLAGVARGCIEDELPATTTFRSANVQVLNESLPSDTGRAESILKSLKRQVVEFFEALENNEDHFADDLSLQALVDLLAFHLPLPLPLKLQLLAEPNVLRRAEFFSRIFSAAEHSQTSGIIPRFSKI